MTGQQSRSECSTCWSGAVACEFWLDANKTLRARVTLDGYGGPRELEQISMSELGPGAVLTQLKDRCLDAEAMLERNAGNDAPLLAELRAASKVAMARLDLQSAGWQAWQATIGVVVASPDLVIGGRHGRE